MRPLLLVLLFCISSFPLLAQNGQHSEAPVADTIRIVKNFGGTTFYHGWKQVKPKDIRLIVQDNEQALKLVNSARTQGTIASIIAFAGGFLCGYEVGAMIAGSNPSYELLGIGAGVIAISIPIAVSANRDMKRAVHTYNEDVKAKRPVAVGRYEVRLESTRNTVGLAFTF